MLLDGCAGSVGRRGEGASDPQELIVGQFQGLQVRPQPSPAGSVGADKAYGNRKTRAYLGTVTAARLIWLRP
ncbi:hypothetical protein ACFWDI_09135 [Streptomyces sp. NPDC060064]|uniref:hypothetical protein n=1 Tax=Streptomyces sp. NPDC060064 TaxID=3347049 RepID=UPI0036BCC6D6